MPAPLISFLCCTVRPEFNCYLEHPEWANLGRLVEMLEAQTFKDFELVVVDGLHPARWTRAYGLIPDHGRTSFLLPKSFPLVHVPPGHYSPWVRRRKVAISAYRNTGIAHANGELIANLDDCCTIPPTYAAALAAAWRSDRTCLAMCWPGDGRQPGRIDGPGKVFGFGSYPLTAALELNGYNEAFDGGQGLEDMEWGLRLHQHGVKQALIRLPGFQLEPQGPHSADAIDVAEPVVKCCNTAWHVCQAEANVRVAGLVDFWGDPAGGLDARQRERRETLTSPCVLLNPNGTCQHHAGRTKCAYLGWSGEVREDVREVLLRERHPVIDLRDMRRRAQNGEWL